MYFDLSLAAIFLDGHLCSKRLFQGVNRCLDVWINKSGTVFTIDVRRLRIARDKHLRLSNRVISLNDPSGGVEYRIEVG